MTRRKIYRKYLRLFIIAVFLNYIWEMAQMPFFENMYFTDPGAWLICFQAAFTDGIIIVFIFLTGRVFFGSFNWADKLRMIKILYLFGIGLSFATYFELKALNDSAWTYSELMAIIPYLKIGIIPVIQMLLLPILSYKLNILLYPELKEISEI